MSKLTEALAEEGFEACSQEQFHSTTLSVAVAFYGVDGVMNYYRKCEAPKMELEQAAYNHGGVEGVVYLACEGRIAALEKRVAELDAYDIKLERRIKALESRTQPRKVPSDGRLEAILMNFKYGDTRLPGAVAAIRKLFEGGSRYSGESKAPKAPCGVFVPVTNSLRDTKILDVLLQCGMPNGSACLKALEKIRKVLDEAAES